MDNNPFKKILCIKLLLLCTIDQGLEGQNPVAHILAGEQRLARRPKKSVIFATVL